MVFYIVGIPFYVVNLSTFVVTFFTYVNKGFSHRPYVGVLTFVGILTFDVNESNSRSFEALVKA